VALALLERFHPTLAAVCFNENVVGMRKRGVNKAGLGLTILNTRIEAAGARSVAAIDNPQDSSFL
jgi:hypothetical protein